ncbi:hypothetical protein EHU49_17165 [Escherichia coli]|nr:hypothetical protein [Escherichia coli]
MMFSSCEMALVVMRQVLIFWLLSLQLQFTSPPRWLITRQFQNFSPIVMSLFAMLVLMVR